MLWDEIWCSNVLTYLQFTIVKRSEQKITKKKLFLTKNNFFYVEKIYIFAPNGAPCYSLFQAIFITTGEMTGAPIAAKIQIFEHFKIMKMLKKFQQNHFMKIWSRGILHDDGWHL